MQEGSSKIADTVTAQLIECAPETEPQAVPLPKVPESTPAQDIARATIEQTGADPPPAVSKQVEPSVRSRLLSFRPSPNNSRKDSA